MPNPSQVIIKLLIKLFFDFIWSKKPDKIKRETLYQEKNNGGLSMLDINSFIKALKITWIRKLKTSKMKWKELIPYIVENSPKTDYFGSAFIDHLSKSTDYIFWHQVLEAYKEFHEISPDQLC